MFLGNPILADFFEVIKYIIGVLFFIFWIAGNIKGANKKPEQAPRRRPQQRPQQNPQQRPAPPRPQPPRPNEVRRLGREGEMMGQARGQRGPQPAQAGDPLADEIEDFLRRAMGKPKKPKPAPRPREVEIINPRQPSEAARPLSRPLSEQQGHGQLRGQPIDPKQDVGNRVSSHVEEHIATSAHTERLSHLGETVGLADDKLEARLEQTFDHSVGTLKHQEKPENTVQEASPMATKIATMLRSPEGITQAVILSEILNRPKDRW